MNEETKQAREPKHIEICHAIERLEQTIGRANDLLARIKEDPQKPMGENLPFQYVALSLSQILSDGASILVALNEKLAIIIDDLGEELF